MAKEYYSIGELAELSGTTIRTIQYYDQIDVLKAKRTETNLRYYTKSDLITLQQILFYKRLDFPLSKIKELIENVENNDDLITILDRQAKLLFQKEMEYKMNQVIIDVVKFYLKLDEYVDLEPLMKLILGLEKQSIMTYAQVEYPSNTADRLEEEGVQFEQIIEIYWDWKQIVLEASILKLNETDIESSASFQIGKKWEMFLEKVGDKDSDMRQVAESGAQLSEQWPEEDLFLFKFSENYIDSAHKYYLKHREGDKDG